jgi:hypothetical protein
MLLRGQGVEHGGPSADDGIRRVREMQRSRELTSKCTVIRSPTQVG